MARFWLHGHHLFIGGKKMSKSRGNILYTDDLIVRGYTASEIRFFLINGHYRKKLDYTEKAMKSAAEQLRALRRRVLGLDKRAGRAAPIEDDRTRRIGEIFRSRMDQDLEVKRAFDDISGELAAASPADLTPGAAAAFIAALREIDGVLQVIFDTPSGV